MIRLPDPQTVELIDMSALEAVAGINVH